MSYFFRTVPYIVAGANSLQSLEDSIEFAGKPRSVLIVAQNAMKRIGVVDDIVTRLRERGIGAAVLTSIRPEPTVANIKEAYDAVKDECFDLVIGIGGGSVLDAAKLIAVMFTNRQPITDMLGVGKIGRKGIPTLLIPTTSGTGSEVTPNVIVTIPEQELKIGIVSPFLLSDAVIIDPVLTLGLPQPITAATGMDAFTHALESFISNKANPISDMFALESIRLLSSSMEQAYQDGSDLQAREKMLLGSMYGGMALTGSGTAAVHALAYPLGGKFQISHGVANSMLLPHVMEFNSEAIIERLDAVAAAMGIGHSSSQAARAGNVIEQIREWTQTLRIPQNLLDFGVTEADIDGLAEAASKVTRLLDNNPRKLNVRQIGQIYRKLLPTR